MSGWVWIKTSANSLVVFSLGRDSTWKKVKLPLAF